MRRAGVGGPGDGGDAVAGAACRAGGLGDVAGDIGGGGGLLGDGGGGDGDDAARLADDAADAADLGGGVLTTRCTSATCWA